MSLSDAPLPEVVVAVEPAEAVKGVASPADSTIVLHYSLSSSFHLSGISSKLMQI